MKTNVKRNLIACAIAPVFAFSFGIAAAQNTSGSMNKDTARTLNPNSATPKGNPSAGGPTWDGPMFDRLDKNKDGRISREEADSDPMMKDHWTRLDSANRGSVTREEFDKYSAMNRTLNPNSATPKGNPSAGGPTPMKK